MSWNRRCSLRYDCSPASSLLFGLQPRDPLTLVLAIAILTAIGFGASFIPARRATRVDPVVALRYE